MGNQSNSQCSQACCDNQDAEERHTNGTFPDDRKEVMITDNVRFGLDPLREGYGQVDAN